MLPDDTLKKGKIQRLFGKRERVRTCGGEVPDPQGCPQPRVVGRVLVHGGGLRGLVGRLLGCLVVPFQRNGRPRLFGGLTSEGWALCDSSGCGAFPVFRLSRPPLYIRLVLGLGL